MISRQGRNLSLAIIAGLVFSLVTWEVSVDGIRLTYVFVQLNSAVYGGLYWQLFTSLFVVIPFSGQGPLGVADVLFNTVAVVWLDGLLSHAFHERDYYVVFFLSGLAGNIASLLNGPNVASFGASGGIFGLLAGAVAEDFAVERRVDYSLLAWFLAVFIFSSFALSYVDWLAHLGGAVSGLVAGYLLGTRRGSEAL
ncbi:MAG: rhomboid family intramembrane serine protease [Nitrososphaerales archaeon]